MKPSIHGYCVLMTALFLSGCSLSPEEKMGREQSLKQTMESFVDSTVQSRWDEVFKMTDGSFDTQDKVKGQITKPWSQDATLTGGAIASLAWVTDKVAKVKLTWTFQSGSVQSFSSDTFVWVWKGNGWKYKGRTLR